MNTTNAGQALYDLQQSLSWMDEMQGMHHMKCLNEAPWSEQLAAGRQRSVPPSW
jgi:hypothetical protein